MRALPGLFFSAVIAFGEWWLQGFRDVQSMTWPRFFQVFWWLIIFDFPRYFLPETVMLFYVMTRWLFRWPRKVQMDPTWESTVSVLVPAHNESESAVKTVLSLLDQDYPISEIIVVDDGSRDDTWEALQRFRDTPGVKLVRNEARGGKASALQTAFSMSSGEFVVSVDSDSTFDRDAVRWLLQYLRDPEVGAVSGNIKVRNRTKTLATWMQASEYAIAIGIGRRVLSYVGWMRVISGAFGAYRREDLLAFGGWDPGIGDDSDATMKVRKRMKKIAFAAEAICLTDAPERWSVLWRQRRRWDKSAYRIPLRKHRDILDPRQFGWSNFFTVVVEKWYSIVLNFSFLFWVFYELLFRQKGQVAWVFIVTFVVYGFANLLSLVIAYGLSERRDEWQLFWTAPFMTLYRTWLRIPRAISTVEEIFGFNYAGSFYPDEVWDEMPRW